MPDAFPAFTPINLLTGFLGSGKTTLLKRLIADPALSDAAVLINEFGEVGLDHHLVERIDETMVLLQSGCLCCTVRGELAAAIVDLHSRRERGLIAPFRRLLIESTGLADPFPVLSTIKAHPVIRHHFRPGNVITTVDAVNAVGQLATYVEPSRQIAIADRIVLTKTDLPQAASAPALFECLRHINPDAPILETGDIAFNVEDLFGEGPAAGSPRQSASGFYCEEPVVLSTADSGRHEARISSFVLTVDEAIDWTAFGIWLTMLLNRHGDRILRVKGILDIAGEDNPVAIHGVQYLVHTPVHMGGWPDRERRSRIVFIVDGLDETLLKRSFAAFVDPNRRSVDPKVTQAKEAQSRS